MALTPAELLRQQALNLDYDDVKELLSSAGLKGEALDALALDWTQKQTNINDIADSTTTLEEQVDQNTQNISTNTGSISTNAQNLTNHIGEPIGAHAASAISFDNSGGLAADNVQDAIDEVDGDLTTHVNADSAHGAGGDIVGNNDFATGGVGGVVNLAANVTDAVQSSVVITSPDATAAPAVYDQTDAQTAVTLVNELSADLTQAITDFNAVTAQLNAFLLANQTAKQMVP